MDPNSDLSRLRRQRNTAALLAALALALGIGLALPGSLSRYRTLRTAQADLVLLQAQIVQTQNEILKDQRAIRELQEQIALARER